MERNKRYIRIPPGENIDIRPVLPVVMSPLFQRLRFVSQLSNMLFVFPGATHNRFEHALGVYHKATQLCARLQEEGILTPAQAFDISLFGLLHDIGHGPFSHLIEDLTPYNHKKNGLRILEELREAIEKCGGNFEFIRECLSGTEPLGKIISDKNLGMDKLDYLDRDTFHIGFGQRPDNETLMDYLSYIKKSVVVDKKALEAAKQIQRLYTYMYKEVYLHKSSLIATRFLQKMVSLWLTLRHVDVESLWLMNDHELMAQVYMDPDPRLQFLYSVYMKRVTPSTGVVFRVDHKQFKERLAGKQIKVIGEKAEFFKRFQAHSSPVELEYMEQLVAKLLKVPAHTVLLVPTLSPQRFAAEDIMYHDGDEVFSLRDTQPGYFESMQDDLEEYLSVRVCIIGNRGLLYEHAEKVHTVLKRAIAGPARRKRTGRNLALEV